jgi:hypothetical protein
VGMYRFMWSGEGKRGMLLVYSSCIVSRRFVIQLTIGFLEGEEMVPVETHHDADDLLSELYAKENQLLPDTSEQVPFPFKLMVDVNR